MLSPFRLRHLHQVQCTVDSQFSTCNVCSCPVLPSCIHDLNADMKAQTDSKLKLIAQSLQRQIDELKLENDVMRAAMKEQAKKVDSISGRQNELLKRGATKQPVTPTPQSEATSVSKSNPNSVTAGQHPTEPVKNCSQPDTKKKDQSGTGRHRLSSVPNDRRHNATGGPKFKIHISRSGTIHNFVIGDSNLRTIDRKRLDRTGKTHVRTMPGARVPDVTASLRACAVRDDVRRIILHVGGNDVHKLYSAQGLETDFKELVAEVTHVFPKAEVAISALLPRKPVPLSVTKHLNSVLRQVCVKGNVSFIFEEDFVDHKVNKPMRLLSDLVHLNMKGLSLWLRKVRAFLGLVTLLKRPGRQSAEEHSHYHNPTAFRVFKNAEPRKVQRRGPTLSSIPVVTGNRVGERFLPGDRSGPAHSPGSRERETVTAQSLARNMHPIPFFHPAWLFPPYRPGPWPNPFPHWYPRPQQGSFVGAY